MSGFLPKGKERLQNVIETIKTQLGAGGEAIETIISPDSEKINCDSTKDMPTLNKEDVTEQLDLSGNEMSVNWKSQENRSLTKSHLTFENNSNLCWLDSSMSLLCHNRTLSRIVEEHSSQIASIRKGYGGAISVLNDYSNESAIEERLQKAKNILQKVQETALDYLTPILKCKEGEPDSAFCSLLNLINENKQIKHLFFLKFYFVRNCTKCGFPRFKKAEKTIITLSKVVSFNPSSPVSLYKCSYCLSEDQEMVIKYLTLPQCLIFHFENGAGKGDLDSLDFELNDRKYKLSGLIKLEKSRDLTVSHFVTWIRDIATDSWLECNDLNTDISSFSVVPPVINLKDIYIAMYEALDDKGTIVNCSENIDTFKIDSDDTSSSDIPVIDLLDEDEGTEIKQENQADKEVSNTVFLGGLFKPDKTDYDSVEKMPQQIDKILSDYVSSVKSMPEPSKNNAESKNEKTPTKKSEILNLDLQDNDLSASSVKNHDSPLQKDVLSNLVRCNSQSNCKNEPGKNVVMNIKQPLVKGSIKKLIKDKVKLLIPYNSNEKSSPANLFLNNSVKISKEIIGNNISRTEKMETLIDKKISNADKRLGENLPGKDYSVTLNNSSRKNSLNASEIQDNSENSTLSRKNTIDPQDSKLDLNISTEVNNSNLNEIKSSSKNSPTYFENQGYCKNAGCSQKSPDEPQNGKLDRKISDFTQAAVQPCAGISDLSSTHKEIKNQSKTVNFISKTCKTVEEEKCTKNTAADFLDNLLTVHDEQTDETSALPDADPPSSDTQIQLQDSGLHLSALPENLTGVTLKKTNDKCNLENKSLDTDEAETQDINTRLPLKSQILDKKALGISSNEIFTETECTAIKQNHILTNIKTTFNLPEEKSTLNSFENKADINISRNVAKHDAKSVKELFVDANNLTLDSSVKECKVNAKSLEDVSSKVSENNNLTSTMQQATILSITIIKQPEDTLDLTVKENEQLNIQAVESKENTESGSLKKTATEQNREFKENNTIFSRKEMEGKNLPTKELFVKLTRLKDSEIEQHLSGHFNFVKTKQIQLLEELTRTVVVKVEQTDSKSILKWNARQAGPSKPTIVENIEPVRKSSRIFARKMKKAAEANKPESLLEPLSRKRKNFEVQIVNNISTKPSSIKRRCLTTPTEVTEKKFKMEDLSKRSNKTYSATDVHASVSSNTFSPTNRKTTDSKLQKTSSVKTSNSEIQTHLQIHPLLDGTSTSQVVADESDVLRVLGPTPDENHDMNKIVPYNRNQVSVQDVSQLSSIHKQNAGSVKMNTHICSKTGEYSPDCESDDFQDRHEAVEYSSNYLYSEIFNFFFATKKKSSH